MIFELGDGVGVRLMDSDAKILGVEDDGEDSDTIFRKKEVA